MDTYSETAVIGSALEPGSAASGAEDRKTEKYRDLGDRYMFQPVAVETTGVYGPRTLQFLKELGKRITTQTGDAREGSWLFQRMSIAVVRGNAAAIMATGANITN